MEHEKKKASGLWYLIGGVAIGTVLGTLFAPKKGSKLREDIREWSRRGREKRNSLMSALSAMVPRRIKAAAALGALKAGGAEAIQVVKEDFNIDGANK